MQRFLANLKSKARQCDMKLTYTNLTCLTELNYSEPVILGLFINGVNDMELQQDLLAEKNMNLIRYLSCGDFSTTYYQLRAGSAEFYSNKTLPVNPATILLMISHTCLTVHLQVLSAILC